MASGSSSAALKGLVRYTVCGSVCRCYSMGVHECISDLANYLMTIDCPCTDVKGGHTYNIAGTTFVTCTDCGTLLNSKVQDLSSTGPHCLTMHTHPVTTNSYNISFCTGALMRRTRNGHWIDSKSDKRGYLSFEQITSPSVGLIPYYKYINPVRASLINTYMSQAICAPCCRYHPSLLLIP